jgi:hypothetical protein
MIPQIYLDGGRKPQKKWFFRENALGDVNATLDFEGGFNGIILPKNLPEEQRDLALWAYEWGQSWGASEARKEMQIEFKRLIGVDPYR